MICGLRNFINGLGGIEPARDAIAWFRDEMKRAFGADMK
jgi:hypothetical protein